MFVCEWVDHINILLGSLSQGRMKVPGSMRLGVSERESTIQRKPISQMSLSHSGYELSQYHVSLLETFTHSPCLSRGTDREFFWYLKLMKILLPWFLVAAKWPQYALTACITYISSHLGKLLQPLSKIKTITVTSDQRVIVTIKWGNSGTYWGLNKMLVIVAITFAISCH